MNKAELFNLYKDKFITINDTPCEYFLEILNKIIINEYELCVNLLQRYNSQEVCFTKNSFLDYIYKSSSSCNFEIQKYKYFLHAKKYKEKKQKDKQDIIIDFDTAYQQHKEMVKGLNEE